MKKKFLVLFLVSTLFLLNGCSSSSKKKAKEPTPVVKKEITPVVEVKPEVKSAPIVAKQEIKEEIKEENKPKEVPNIIIVVLSKEDALEVINAIVPTAKYEIKGLEKIQTETKQDLKSEIKPETKLETPVVTNKIVESKKVETNLVVANLENKEPVKIEQKEPVSEKIIVENKIVAEPVKPKQEIDKISDTDKDGLPDYLDSVPNQVLKETLIAQGIQKVIITDDTKETDNKFTPQMMDELDKIAAIMKKDKTLKIKIIAHTNNIGDEKVNLKLSEKKSIMAENYLNSKGIPLDYVATDWKGESMPLVSNDTKENRDKNKRLEIIFYIVNLKSKK